MTYADIISDGGLDPRNAADTDASRLAAHRDLHRTVHQDISEAVRHRIMVEAANTEAEIRAKLIDMGWRPPTKPVNQPQVPTKAWLHATSDACVTTDPTAYDKGRQLVLKDDVRDHVEWLEAGIDEWRSEALTHRKHAAAARATAAIAIRHLQAILNADVTATQAWQAKQEARQWLESIGG